MQDYPHHYVAGAAAAVKGNVNVTSPGLESLDTAPPAEFGGPGDLWSPETMFVAAVANCLILTFRAVARASKVEWINLECEVQGTLDKVDKVTSFTRFDVRAKVTVPAGQDEARAIRALEKSDKVCLITNSLNGETHLEAEVVVEST